MELDRLKVEIKNCAASETLNPQEFLDEIEDFESQCLDNIAAKRDLQQTAVKMAKVSPFDYLFLDLRPCTEVTLECRFESGRLSLEGPFRTPFCEDNKQVNINRHVNKNLRTNLETPNLKFRFCPKFPHFHTRQQD